MIDLNRVAMRRPGLIILVVLVATLRRASPKSSSQVAWTPPSCQGQPADSSRPGYAESCPCVRSGMCSLSSGRVHIGPLTTLGQLRAAVHTMAYRKEVSGG